MRTPRSTDGSYWKVNCGVRLRRSSAAIWRWRTPCAAASPSRELARFFSDPSTLTYTVAWWRSGDVSTPVIVTKPIRGSFRPPTASASTARTDSLTRRIRSLGIERHHLPVDPDALELLPVEVSLGV